MANLDPLKEDLDFFERDDRFLINCSKSIESAFGYLKYIIEHYQITGNFIE